MNKHQIRSRHRKISEEQGPKEVVMSTFRGATEIASKTLNINSYDDRNTILKTVEWAYHNDCVIEFGTEKALKE